MEILEVNVRITQIINNHMNPLGKHENHYEKFRIPYENHEHYENHRIPYENNENHEIHRIQLENYENH